MNLNEYILKQKVKRIKRRLNTYFIYLLIAPTILWMGVCMLGIVSPGLYSLIDYDLKENREKAAFPDHFSNTWFTDLESYYNDRAPFRSILTTTNQNLSSWIEKPYDQGIRNSLIALLHKNDTAPTPAETIPQSTFDIADIFGGPDPATQAAATEASKSPSTESPESSQAATLEETLPETTKDTLPIETLPPETLATIPEDVSDVIGDIDTTSYFPLLVKNNNTILGRGDWLYLYAYNNLDYYLGSNLLPEDTKLKYLEAITRFCSLCSSQNKETGFLIAPNKEHIYPEYLPNLTVENEPKREQILVDYLTASCDAKITYPVKELQAMKNYFLCYAKYDSHWNAVGAYTGYQMLRKAMGLSVTDILRNEIQSEVSTDGDLIRIGGLSLKDYQNDRAYTIGYQPNVTILSRDGEVDEQSICHTVSDSPNQKTVVVIGDSYRIQVAKFLSKDFTDVYYVHMNNIADPAVPELLKKADMILFILVERNDASLPPVLNDLSNFLK